MVAEMREQDVGTILLDNLANLVQAFQQDVINFAGSNCDVLDKGLGCQNQIMQALFCLQNVILALSRDDDFVSCSCKRACWAVAEYGGEKRWKVDGGARAGLNELDVSSVSTADEGVQRKFELDGINLSAKL